MAIRAVATLLSAFLLVASAHAEQEMLERTDWERFFSDLNATGTVVVADERRAERVLLVFDQTRAKRRYPPASTFKIPHTLFALDASVVRDGPDHDHPPPNAEESPFIEPWSRPAPKNRPLVGHGDSMDSGRECCPEHLFTPDRRPST